MKRPLGTVIFAVLAALVTAIAGVGLLLLSTGNRDLGRNLIGTAVALCWAPILVGGFVALRRRNKGTS